MRVMCHTARAGDGASGVGALLERVLRVSSDALVVDEYGKPRLADGSAEISLSWAPGIAVLAIAEAAVGVDVDPKRAEYTELDRLALERAVGPELAAEWMTGAGRGEAAGRRFSEVWTRLEAILKADGRGFSAEPRDHPAVLAGWETTHIDLGDHIVCVAAREIPLVTVVEHSRA